MSDGGPAFPKESTIGPCGMSLLDWFASTATDEDVEHYLHFYIDGHAYTRTRAEARYCHADAMIKARSRKPGAGE